MIARIWTATSSAAQAPAYAAHLRQRVLPALQSVAGYAGAMLLEQQTTGGVEFIVITFWQSMKSIEQFAGTDVESAVVADEAAALLTRFDRCVRHFEVKVSDLKLLALSSARIS